MNLELMAYLTDPHRLWAIDQPYLARYKVAAEAHDGSRIEARGPETAMVRSGNVAVIDVAGPISPRPSIFSMLFGGSAISTLQADFRQAMADESVKAVLFAFSTPGGEVSGVSEFAAEIASARGKGKPIVAHVGQMAASAGYWLVAAADEIASSKDGLTGSIGVLMTHADESAALEQEGVKLTIISAGKYKAEGASSLPLSDEAKDYRQSMVDAVYADMTNEIGGFRGVSGAAVRAGYGEGRVLLAKAAKAAGLVDRIATLNETLARLSSGRSSRAGMRAEDSVTVLPAREGHRIHIDANGRAVYQNIETGEETLAAENIMAAGAQALEVERARRARFLL